MPHVISELSAPNADGIIQPQVAIDLGRVPFSTSDGVFTIPPVVGETGLPTEYLVVALHDADHAAAVALGYTSCTSVDPCEVA